MLGSTSISIYTTQTAYALKNREKKKKSLFSCGDNYSLLLSPMRNELAKLLKQTRNSGRKSLAREALIVGKYERNICRAINILINKSLTR